MAILNSNRISHKSIRTKDYKKSIQRLKQKREWVNQRIYDRIKREYTPKLTDREIKYLMVKRGFRLKDIKEEEKIKNVYRYLDELKLSAKLEPKDYHIKKDEYNATVKELGQKNVIISKYYKPVDIDGHNSNSYFKRE